MTKDFLYEYMGQHKFGVMASVSPQNTSQSALVGFAITPDLELIFDTVSDSRKYANLVTNPNISFVIGWENERTLQYEGIAKIIITNDPGLLEIYYAAFPDGRERKKKWENIVYFCIEPKWIRYSDFSEPGWRIEEMRF